MAGGRTVCEGRDDMTTDQVFALLGVIVGAFSVGYSTAMYFTSSYHVHERVEKELEAVLKEQCARCQKKERTSATTETTSDRMDK